MLRDATVTRLQHPVQYMLCSEHIIRNSIRKTNTRPVWRKEKMRIKNWFEKKIFVTNMPKHYVLKSER